jgi:hypothetical protein
MMAADSHIGFIATLHDWQDLAGAIIGALMGVVGALIVASRATQRERRIAAAALLPELQNFRGAHGTLVERAATTKHTPGAVAKVVCLSLLHLRPVASVLHSPALGQLSDVHPALYAHLYHCQMIHRYFEQGLAEFAELENAAKAAMPPPNAAEFEERIQRKAVSVFGNWNLIAEHAAMAEYMLDRFIFRLCPVWAFSLRMRLLPNDLDRRSAYLLKEGKPLSPAKEEKKPILDEHTSL